jgi:hypothetical protein
VVNAASFGVMPFLVCLSEQTYVRLFLAHKTSMIGCGFLVSCS